jgi:hypothetical protein
MDGGTPAARFSTNRDDEGFHMDYREFLNPQPQQLSMFIHGLCQALHIDFATIPYERLFEQRTGAYLDPLSRMALGWEQDRQGQLIVRLRWL